MTRTRRLRIAAIATAAVLAAGLGLGVGKIAGKAVGKAAGLGDAGISTAIPQPAKGKDAFVEDDDLIAADNQANILQTTAPGLVHVLEGGTSVATGLVLTPSGKVLTTYRPAAGASNLTAEYVLSRMTFKATVIGTDPAAGLALLQLQGGNGRPFSTVTVGNSDTLVRSAKASKVFSYHVPGEVFVTAIGTAGRQNAVTIDVGTLAALDTTVSVGGRSRGGLLAAVLQSAVPSAIGGPLVNLNGQVIGLIVGGSGKGLHVVGYAVPINTVLAVAARLDHDHS